MSIVIDFPVPDEGQSLMCESVGQLLAEHVTPHLLASAETGVWPAPLWERLVALGFVHAAVPEERGGSGLPLSSALSVLVPAGYHAAPVRLGEAIVGAWLVSRLGLPTEPAPVAVAPGLRADRLSARWEGAAWRVSGMARAVAWNEAVETVAVLCEVEGTAMLGAVPAAACAVRAGRNLAGESRVDLVLDDIPVLAFAEAGGIDAARFYAIGAAMRALLMAGALRRVVEMSAQYATERVQFGRPIAKFQAIQQYLAAMVGQAASADVSAQAALASLDDGGGLVEIATAKVRCGEAANLVARHAHQIHGAMGFTHEHALHHFTRRLWAWRDEFGNEAHWARRLGRLAVGAGPRGLWRLSSR